jgi:hypothetical protein
MGFAPGRAKFRPEDGEEGKRAKDRGQEPERHWKSKIKRRIKIRKRIKSKRKSKSRTRPVRS